MEFKCIQFTITVFESCWGSRNSLNIMFDEISTLHHALIDLCLENKVGVSSKIRFKMDTRVSGNLLPVSTYCKLFPNHTMKDPGLIIDPSVELLTATKSSIKQLCTVNPQVYQSLILIHLSIFVVPNKSRPIPGLPDLMWLNPISFNCRVSKSWDGYDTWFAFDSCEEKSGTFLNKDTVVSGQRFKSIFSGTGRFPVDPVNIQLTNDAVPVQNQHVEYQSP